MNVFRKLSTLKMKVLILCLLLCLGMNENSFGQQHSVEDSLRDIDNYIQKLMDEGDVPALSVVVIKNGRQTIRSYGYADLQNGDRVSSRTLFPIGPCSESFLALAIMNLVKENKLSRDQPVSEFIPWLVLKFEGRPVQITVDQLLHHTSGISWNAAAVRQINKQNGLEQAVRQLNGKELNSFPGKKFEHTAINYGMLALIAERITRQPIERYIQEKILTGLGIHNTMIGKTTERSLMATGYKISFFKARKYNPTFSETSGATGYVITNAEDMGKWLSFQMGLIESALYPLAKLTHQRDETVPLHNMASHAMGWEVSLSGNGEIYREGLSPAFSSYVAFRPKNKIGVALLSNVGNNYTSLIGDQLLKKLAGEEVGNSVASGNRLDKVFSIISIITGGYILIVVFFLTLIIVDVAKRKRKYQGFSAGKVKQIMTMPVILCPFLFGLYVTPGAIGGYTWETIVVLVPASFEVACLLIIAAFCISYLVYIVGLLFPEKNKFRSIAPRLILFSILSGVANMVVIMLITTSIGSDVELKYLIFYYVLALSAYLFGRKYVQVNLVKLSRQLTFELRGELINKMLSTSYQRFEQIKQGRIYTALNDDVNTLGESTNLFVMMITSVFTMLGAFIYLASIALWATVLTIALMFFLAILYFFVGKSTHKYFNEARNTRDNLVHLMNGMIDGYKEISLSREKKLSYEADINASADEFREKITIASTRFVNTFLVGDSLVVIVLGVVSFGIPNWFPEIQLQAITSFIVVLLYLVGPVNGILNSVPNILQFKIALKRIQQFQKEIPANLDLKSPVGPIELSVASVKASGLGFQYKNVTVQTGFEVGPVDLEIKKGEILFIIGGNGSGKTTLAKLLTGLYEPDQGEILINNRTVKSSQLSEYFSVVFNPPYLFNKLYRINTGEKAAEIRKYLKILRLEEKVSITDNGYSTINLSSGQKKRLALLQCYLEDSPIYLFDEFAADQDPEFRHYFYRVVLPQMKEAGKIIIAITHDDHYFDVADKVLKMNLGKLEPVKGFKRTDDVVAV